MKSKQLLVIIALLILLIQSLGFLDALNEKIYNNYMLFNKDTSVSSDIVIVEIDHKSITEIGYYPWKRSIYADLLNKIKDYPSVIGIMLSFTYPQDVNEDTKLYETLKNIPNVVLMAKYNFKTINNLSLVVPVKSIFPTIKQGHGLVDYSNGGIVESFQPIKKFPAFALLITKLFFADNENNIFNKTSVSKLFKLIEDPTNIYSVNQHILIDYKKIPEQFQHYSFVDVLDGKIDYNELKDKIVLIGITDKYQTGSYITPFTGKKTQGRTSTPIEVQAQIIDSLLNYRQLIKTPKWLVSLISVLLFTAFFFFIKDKSSVRQGILLLVVLVIFSIIDIILFMNFAIWFPPALPIILLVVSFAITDYFKTTKIENILIETINETQIDNSLPLEEIPSDITSKVTSLKQLLEIIGNDRKTIKSIIDGINNGIIVFDELGKIVWINEQIKKHFSHLDLLTYNITSILTDLDLQEVKHTISVDSVYKTEAKIEFSDYYCIITLLDTKTAQYVVIFNDITYLKQMDRLKSSMVKMVSHELKSPLTSIKLCAENILFLNESEISVDHANRICNTSDHLLETINDFLHLGKLESNIMTMDPEHVDISDIINESVELNKPLAQNKNLEIKIDIRNRIKPVMVDKKQLLIVMNVLLSNAIKYSNVNDYIIIELRSTEEYLTVSIIDNGIGIPEDEIDKVFDKFYRSINNKSNNIEGTGLGLTIAKMILDLHNAPIVVESRPGKGSKFSLNLYYVD